MSIQGKGSTCTEVPAFAGSMPIIASPKGSAVPVSTELITMQNSEAEIATESMRLPSVMYTRAKPATAPRSNPYNADMSEESRRYGRCKRHPASGLSRVGSNWPSMCCFSQCHSAWTGRKHLSIQMLEEAQLDSAALQSA